MNSGLYGIASAADAMVPPRAPDNIIPRTHKINAAANGLIEMIEMIEAKLNGHPPDTPSNAKRREGDPRGMVTDGRLESVLSGIEQALAHAHHRLVELNGRL
jgi:hypothetical protein